MKTLILALSLFFALPSHAHAQSLWHKVAIICRTEDQARATIALNNGHTAVPSSRFKFARGCRVRVVEFIRLASIEPEPIWHGIRFKVVWIAVIRMEEMGVMRTFPFVSLFTIVWEHPTN